MSKVTTKLITATRLRQLLDCYGADSTSWPEDERQAALSLLRGYPELTNYREQIHALDRLLKQLKAQEDNVLDQQAVQTLQQRIMHNLPEQTLPASNNHTHDHTTDNQVNSSRQSSHRSRMWMGSIAASLFIVSLSVGVIYQHVAPEQETGNMQTNHIAGNDLGDVFTQWAWEDITGETLATATDSEPATLLALVELELPVE